MELDSQKVYELGITHFEAKDIPKAMEYWTISSNLGHLQASFCLAFEYYALGDYYQAFMYCMKSEEYKESQCLLGFMYFQGKYVSKNYQTSFEYFSKSASQKYNTSILKLKLLNEYGFTFEKSKEECGACYEDLSNTYIYTCKKCKNSIHANCFQNWNKTCMYCRTGIPRMNF